MDKRVTVDRWSQDEKIAIITIDNPPVNAMSIGIPQAILDHVKAFSVSDDVSGILINAADKGVLGGADIKVQGKPWPKDQANLIDLIADLDLNDKPVAILLRQAAVGGGLEIAMACRYRIAQSGTRLGQPEVRLGIPPGAGGTQRLPRLVGADKALDMILSGDPILAEEALEIGLIDHVVSSENALDEAAQFLAEQIAGGDIQPRTRERKVEVVNPELFTTARERISKRFKGQVAPMACIDCVEMATKMDFDEGFAYERKRFLECVVAEEAVSLRHVFFAERQSKKIPGIDPKTRPRSIETAVVVGAGTMGAGIATSFANAGIPVTLVEQNPNALAAGMKRISDSVYSQVKRGRITEDQAALRVGLVNQSLELDIAENTDVVVEAVFEDLEVKKSVFGEIAKHAKPGAILATNTSYLNVDQIARATHGREQDVLGLHFFSPAHIMKLVEAVRGEQTSDETLLTGLNLAARLGKNPVVSGVGHGFIGNRMFYEYNREAEFLLQEGATCQQVDNALENFGMAMGSFVVRDLAGLDIGWAMRKSTAYLRNPEERYSLVGDLICERGWFGQKTGKGFYLYKDRQRSPNPDVQPIVDSTAEQAGIQSGEVSDEQVIERCLYSLVNTGARLLEEGIALRASDIDLVFIYGYGFPRWRGGPMHWADHVGLPVILSKIEELNESRDFWQPSSLLQQLVKEGMTFARWDQEQVK